MPCVYIYIVYIYGVLNIYEYIIYIYIYGHLVFLTPHLVFLTPPCFLTPHLVFLTPHLVFLTPHLVFLTPCFFNPLTLFFWPRQHAFWFFLFFQAFMPCRGFLKMGPYSQQTGAWNLAALETCWNLSGTLPDPGWNRAEVLLEPCWNFTGTFLAPCDFWNIVRTLRETVKLTLYCGSYWSYSVLYKLKQLYCVLSLLCIALVVSFLMNKDKTPYKFGTFPDSWNLEPWKPGTPEPW